MSTIKAAIEPMIERRRGRIVIVSSAMAMIGFAGYSIYAPTKWALRALGDCLRNEFKPYNVMVQVFCPANMLTPAFEQENITKPEVTKVIEGNVLVHLFDLRYRQHCHSRGSSQEYGQSNGER